MNFRDVLNELAKLELPLGEYVVVGGASLTLRGIRETGDIDLVVTQRLFAELERAGWHRKSRPNGKPGLRLGCAEAYLDVNCGEFEKSTDWLLKNSETAHGIPVLDLETLVGFKSQYRREKDIQDLILIEQHLAIHWHGGRVDG